MSKRNVLQKGLCAAFGASWCFSVGLDPVVAAELPVPCFAGTCGNTVPGWVSSGAATGGISGNTFTVNQTTSSVTLNWQNFNVSADGTVTFNQPDASSVALNRIFQNDPSKIFGSLNANGRVYLLNQNGFLFGDGARVNVGGLVASSLNITPDALELGIARAVERSSPAFERFTDATGKALKSGDIKIEKGAELTAKGGQILVFAPNVTNTGKISTPDGQTILGAGNSVFLAASTDPNLRGLLIEVGTGGETIPGTSQPAAGGAVTNGEAANGARSVQDLVGTISADRGNVTLAGSAVNQLGRVSATTSVRANGSIRLQARDTTEVRLNEPVPRATRSGTLDLGARSLTEVALDSSTDTTVDVNTQPRSDIKLAGHTIAIQSGATVRATSGSIEATALTNPRTDPDLLSAQPDDSRVYVAKDATLDVSGASVDLAVERNSLRVELRGTQLADSPLVRDGFVRGQPVFVDVRKSGTRSDGSTWVGSPIGDLKGDVGTIARDVRERNLAGGSISLISQGAVLVDDGAKLDVSGGQINWQGGTVKTSALLGKDGKIYDMANAERDREYVSIVDQRAVRDQRWGTEASYMVYGDSLGGVREDAHVEGKDAGLVSIRSPRSVLDGDIVGRTVIGPQQRLAPGTIAQGQLYRSYDQRPLGARLVLGMQTPQLDGTLANFVALGATLAAGPTLSSLRNEDGSAFRPLEDPLPESLNETFLRPDLLGENKVTRLGVFVNGEFLVPATTLLDLPGASELIASAGHTEFAGTFRSNSGNVDLSTRATSLFAQTPQPAPADEPPPPAPPEETKNTSLMLASSAVIDVSGRWVNERQLATGRDTTSALLIDGGRVSLTSSDGALVAQQGASIDASGGARQLGNNSITGGKGGSISITGRSSDLTLAAPVTLGADLAAYGLTQGGALSIAANSVCISATVCETTDENPLFLRPADFTKGGFANYSVRSNLGNLEVAAGTQIDLEQTNRELLPTAAAAPSGTSFASLSRLTRLADQRRAPTNLTLGASVVRSGPVFVRYSDLILGTDSHLQLDPQARVSLTSNSRILLDGTIDAPAGSISVLLDSTLSGDSFLADQGVWLGANANLDVAGLSLLRATDFPGQLVGNVLGGGTVSMEARRGYIVTHAASVIDVSGAKGTIDIRQGNGLFTSQGVYSSGGTVQLTAAEGMLLNGNFRAAPVAPEAMGGTLQVTVDASKREDSVLPTTGFAFASGPRQVHVIADLSPNLVGFGTPVPSIFQGVATVSAPRVQQGGFDNVVLTARDQNAPFDNPGPPRAGRISLDGGVTLAPRARLELDAAQIDVRTTGEVDLSSSVVRLGASVLTPDLRLPIDPAAGPGKLAVHGGLIELVGNTNISGASSVLLESSGDIRVRGLFENAGKTLTSTFNIAGDTELRMEQLYPTTLTVSTINVIDGDLALTSSGSGPAADVLSAGGELHLKADRVDISSRVRAPFGKIDIVADELNIESGGVLSTSADKVIPFGRLQGGFAWVYQTGTQSTRIFASNDQVSLPEQGITLTSDQFKLADGATIDFSGGGDLLAAEFQPGPGGTRDILSADQSPNLFAIVPGLNLDYSAYDLREYQGSSLQPGDRIHLDAASNGLPAGDYTLLPARYALLEGGFTVTAAAGNTDLPASMVIGRTDGSAVVSGYRTIAGTSIRDSRSSGFLVTPGATFAKQAQYTVATASDLFNDSAAAGIPTGRLPRDAGSLAITASGSLDLSGSVRGAAQKGGLGGIVDIAADRLRVAADDSVGEAGFVTLLANQLDNLAVESVLLGGKRTRLAEADAVRVAATTRELRVDSGAAISGPEVLMVAKDSIDVAEGASIRATGSVANATKKIELANGAGLLRVSSGGQVDVTRESGGGGTGAQITLAAGSSIGASGSITLDSLSAPVLNGAIDARGASFQVGADNLVLSADGGSANEVALSAAQLASLQLGELKLLARDEMRLEGAFDLGVQRLALSAQTIRAGSADTRASMTASDSLTLIGTDATPSALDPASGGSVSLSGQTVHFGAGNLQFAGFDSVAIGAQSPILLADAGSLASAGDLTLTGGLAFAKAGIDYSINSLGALSVLAASSATPAMAAQLGGQVKLAGDTVRIDAPIIAPSGHVAVSGEHDVVFGASAKVDLAASRLIFDEVQVALPGGQLDVLSRLGAVDLLAGSSIVANAAGTADAGAVNIRAGNGRVTLGGSLSAAADAGGAGGRLSIDAQSLDFASAVAAANAGGFTKSFAVRKRGLGDLVLASGNTLHSSNVSLTADQGSINVAGTIDASSRDGGHVMLAARDAIDLSGTIDARALQASSAARARIDLQSAGQLFVRPGAVLDVTVPVSGGDTAEGRGIVALRLPRASVLSVLNADAGDDALQIGGTVRGTDGVIVEGYATYTDNDIDSTDVLADVSNPLFADAQSFSDAAAPGLANALRPQAGLSLFVRPGIEIVTDGDMHLSADWDLAPWRFNEQPGVLTLRTGGNLFVDQSLSDGFDSLTDFALPAVSSESWSYRLVAGGDVVLASGMSNPNDQTTPPDPTMIRTGTGQIDISAGGNIVFGNQASVIYTAGVSGPGVRLAADPLNFEGGLGNLAYPHRGGDISMAAGGDVVGAPTTQLFDWLARTGCQVAASGCTPIATAWTIAFDQFEQGVGALGGGSINIAAGGSVRDLWAVSPSIGRQIGGATAALNDVQVIGGGNVNVTAGADFLGGGVYVGRGKGSVNVLRNIGLGVNPFGQETGSIFALGDAQISASARANVRVDALINPTLMPNRWQGLDLSNTQYSTYTDTAGASLLSTGGSMTLGNASLVEVQPLFNGLGRLASLVAPPTVTGVAASGKLNVAGAMTLWPAPRGNLTLMARDNVTFRSSLGADSPNVILSDADLSILPTITSAVATSSDSAVAWQVLTSPITAATGFYAQRPTHGEDPEPMRIVSMEGDVQYGVSSDTVSGIFSAKRVRVVAGRDIVNMNLIAQNTAADDVSSLIAGRDIRYQLARDANGRISQSLLGITLGGGGQLELVAGRDVDLQTSVGITTDANLRNVALSNTGANVSITAGLNGREPDYAGMIAGYITNGAYDEAVAAYVKRITGDTVSAEEARARFLLLPHEQQRTLLQQVLLAELRAGGRSAAAPGPGNKDFTRAFKALETYFPGSNPDVDAGEENFYSGDISLYFSKVYTLQGGDVSLFAPGGEINAGLATPPSSYGISKGAADLGVVARSSGTLSAVAYNDFLVNESRFFAGDGGNILVWSTRGDIDAGRGAKTAISAPPPVITIDEQGQPRIVFPAAFTGSGIQTLATTQGRKPGDVDLFAPRGVVNAGDAGIVAGNLTIAATAVLGTDNIQVSGVSVGVPVDTGGLGASLAGVSSVASSASAAADAAVDASANDKQSTAPLADTAMSWLDVFVEGFGAENCKPNDAECLQRNQKTD